MLRIDKDALLKEFMSHFFEELDSALENWKKDVEKFSSEFIKELGVPKADTNKILYETSKMIVVYFKANPTLLADIYGTGSRIDKSNPKFKEYWMERGPKQGQVNPARSSVGGNFPIQGRPVGKYTDIFGNTRTSTGSAEGENIEKGFIQPIEPNRELLNKYFGTAIEIGNKFFETTYLKRAISNAIKETKMYNHIEEVN